MDWLAKYWWVLVLIFLIGVQINVIKDLKSINLKKYIANKSNLQSHHDFINRWNDKDK